MSRTFTQPAPLVRPSRQAMEARLAELEAEREALAKQKRRNILFMGAAISLMVHLAILLYLETVKRLGPGGDGPGEVIVEFAVLPQQDLSELELVEIQDSDASSDLNLEEADPALELDVKPPAAELLALNDGSMPSLGAGGSSSGDMSMGGGGAGASFFGVSSTGQRFLFIVDVSGSMQEGNRIHVAMRELSRSISELPDFAYFYVILYNHEPIIPRFQRGWQRARPREVDDMLDYLRNVTPGGGTVPVGAFAAAFALDVPPDVIFFLTDGLIPQETPDRVRSMNARGKRVVINTIAFGDQSSADLLKRISDESGGRYRFVPVHGGG